MGGRRGVVRVLGMDMQKGGRVEDGAGENFQSTAQGVEEMAYLIGMRPS